MLLLIDAGNTRVKWALVPRGARNASALGQWMASGMVDHAQIGTLGDAWRGHKIAHVLISNVAGQAMREKLEQALSHVLGLQPVPLEWFASCASLAGVRNHYRNPAQLGCDRFASVIGAHALHPGKALVVATCGTATTVDAVTPDGIFQGGMILPGLGLMAASLARNTAQLPEVAETTGITEPFADHTDAAIISGCIAAQTGAIERAVRAHRQHHGEVQCVLSGGAAPLIAPHLGFAPLRVDNLVLIGLHHVAMNTSC
ncbi:type III pantothenate kinase [Noviherbaspirillum sp. CPCC 100848]|uniref:Type III pantothenate kinase n=1 Tax=Noviherbaspirillum album TaxID=3080276 RepID=A0ABU6JGN0_9BURK|nr:type III pantothenate kinase [Noviherbaspirillum sp. CPCC 100848]MEC4722631.1 type III pantothenate kinase [Noviherbaspirillum sp. CPCC 100848]